jgi:hypothetical protein
MDTIFGLGPHIIALTSFALSLTALIALVGMDAVTGKFSSTHMMNNNEGMGWFMSLGTTGVVLALVGMVMYSIRERWHIAIILLFIAMAAIPVCIDIYFDGMSVDIIRFGQFVDLSAMPPGIVLPMAEILPHKLFRVMVGALSAVGEPLAALSVIIFPIMRELFKGAS